MVLPFAFNQYEKARPLFTGLEFHLAVPALLAGDVPGMIWVDDPAHPKAVLARVGHRFYLAGQADRADFNRLLQEEFARVILPQGRAAGGEGFTLYYSGVEWEAQVEEVILQDHFPVRSQRQYYVIDPTDAPPAGLPPAGFDLLPVDRSLVERRGLRNLDDLLEEMQSERESVPAFLEASFGTCLLDGDVLASWCLSEYNHGLRCEVGIATHEDYRRRGLATFTGRAFLEAAVARGIHQVGWHCFTANHASAAAALKIGYRKAADYPGYFASFDPVTNLAIHGDLRFDAGEYDAALAWLERAFALGEAPRWAYVEAAGASARLGEPETAFRYLQAAVDRGLRDPARLRSIDFLIDLHAFPDWDRLLAGLEAEDPQ